MIEVDVFQQIYSPGIEPDDNDHYQFAVIHWLNTPGPIFVGQSDNCGTGQPVAMNHVIGDDNYFEAVFRQPKSSRELVTIKEASSIDPFQGYSFSGSFLWEIESLQFWWSFTEDIERYIQRLYEKEKAFGPGDPHVTTWNLGGEIRQLHLYGPGKAIPENYNNWLTYYRSGEMKQDVREFAFFLDHEKLPEDNAILPEIDFQRPQRITKEMIEQRQLFT